MKKIKDFNLSQVPNWQIVFVVSSDKDYEMQRHIYVEGYPNYDDCTIIEGSHCSCYDFDDTEWEAITYTQDELITIMKNWYKNGYGTERVIAPMILKYLSEIKE